MTAATEDPEVLARQARLIISRLEKITPDSTWAHRASGCRGTLIHFLENQAAYWASDTESGEDRSRLKRSDLVDLRSTLDLSYEILEGAAVERLQQRRLSIK
jgi:hypothetical protein